MSSRRNVTVCDIAQAAGVAQASVSAALHGTGRVSEATRQRIQRLAREMGYEPRVAAQLLRRRKTGQWGIIVADYNHDPLVNPVWGRVVSRFVSRCEQERRGYHIEVHHHRDDAEGFRPPVQIAGRLVDGTIVVGDVGRPLRQWLSAHANLPWVSIMEPAPLCVLSAEDRGTKRIVEYLVSLGHRRIAHLADDQRYLVHRYRHTTFVQAIEDFGLEQIDEDWVKIIEQQNTAAGSQRVFDWVESLLDRPVRPTAIIGAQRDGIYAALRRGLALPEELSIVGWEVPDSAERHFRPALTSIESDPQAMLDAAWELLEERLAGQTPKQPVRWIEPQLVIRQSTAPPRGVEAKR